MRKGFFKLKKLTIMSQDDRDPDLVFSRSPRHHHAGAIYRTSMELFLRNSYVLENILNDVDHLHGFVVIESWAKTPAT